jgi:hypothetical protein
MKTCSKCKIEKELTDFYKRKNSIDGYRKSCKNCQSLYNKDYNDKNKNKVKEQKSEYRKENKEILKNKRRKYYESKKEITKENSLRYYHNNKDKRDFDYHKIHWIKNKESISKKRKERRENNPLLKLSSSIRTLIWNSIKRMGFTKKSKTCEILGCQFEDFKSYIEYQFVEGMSWENHGEWHLDHKKPISWAETEEQVYELNHYTNFQPLWAKDNLSKGNKWSD